MIEYILSNFNQFYNKLNIPIYHFILELILITILVYLYYKKSFPIHPHDFKLKLTDQAQEQLISEWKPEPLVPDDSDNPYTKRWNKIISSKPCETIVVNDIKCINFATPNFYGFVNDPKIEKLAIEIIGDYGVGTCGPRGFYGTNNIHLAFEKRFSEFLRVEAAILYSYGISCVSSSIPAYIKYKDYVFVDQTINYNILVGLKASKANIIYYARNDLGDLERRVQRLYQSESKDKKKFKALRFFVIAEAVSQHYGDILDLKKLVELKFKYKLRIFLDESLSFGILGETGRGITEYSGIDPNIVDLIIVNLEMTFATTGGFCAGSKYVINHQVLSGLGYCFSASLPTYLTSSAIAALDILDENPEIIANFREKSSRVYDFLKNNIPATSFCIDGQVGSPIFQIRFRPNIYSLDEQIEKLCQFEKMSIQDYGIAFNIRLPLNSHINLNTTCLCISSTPINKSNLKKKITDEDLDSDNLYYLEQPKQNQILPSIIIPINSTLINDLENDVNKLFDPLIKCLKFIEC